MTTCVRLRSPFPCYFFLRKIHICTAIQWCTAHLDLNKECRLGLAYEEDNATHTYAVSNRLLTIDHYHTKKNEKKHTRTQAYTLDVNTVGVCVFECTALNE